MGGVPDGQGSDDLLLAAVRPHGRELFAERPPQSTSSRNPQIAGKVGYAVVPGNPEHATGYNKALSADSANPEAAYLFMQWACSPPVSLARCMLPYALRDPYRISHFKSELYGALFPSAKEYLSNLNNSANVGLLDPIMPGAQDYFLSIDRMCTAVWAGADPKASLETAAAEWNETTDRLGVDSQKAFYTEFLKLPGATADNTVEKLGMAVTLESACGGTLAGILDQNRCCGRLVRNTSSQPPGRFWDAIDAAYRNHQSLEGRWRARHDCRASHNGRTATSNGCWWRQQYC